MLDCIVLGNIAFAENGMMRKYPIGVLIINCLLNFKGEEMSHFYHIL